MYRGIFLLFLAGCAHTGAEPVSLPDGSAGYAIQCNGTARSFSDCMNKAAEVCGTYEIVTQEQNSPGSMALGNGLYGNAQHRTMYVKCS